MIGASVQRIVRGPLLQFVLDRVEKAGGVAAVEQAMVEGERQIHHAAHGDQILAILLDRPPGRFTMAAAASMPHCGGLMIDIDQTEPRAPVLLTVNVPPCMSSMRSCLLRARIARSLIALESPARLFSSA